MATVTTTLLEAEPFLPSPKPQTSFHKVLGFCFLSFCIKKIITDTISKTQMPLVEGRAENAWVPPEGQHQGLHGPPTSPTLEQLGVQTPGSSLGPRLPSPHVGRRWERELSPPINKCSPNPRDWDSGSAGIWRAHFSSLSATLSRRRASTEAGVTLLLAGLKSSTLCSLEARGSLWTRAGDGGPAP